MKLLVEISAGELIDKITILEIKRENIHEPAKLANVAREYASLTDTLKREMTPDEAVEVLRLRLRDVNADLWRIEDEIRAAEREGRFEADFIALARAVYRVNDRRADFKRQINIITRSDIVEEKSYAAY